MMQLFRRAVLATLPALALAACGGRPGATQVAQDAQLVLAAITPLSRGALGFGVGAAGVADIGEARNVAEAEAANLAAQVIPMRIDVQEFVLAARTLARTLRAAPALPPDSANIIDAVTALLPVMTDQVSAPFAGPAPAMAADQARRILRGAVSANATQPPSAPAQPAASPPLAAAERPAEPPPTPSQAGLLTARSRFSPAETVSRLETAIRGRGWTVFTTVDHAAAARAAGLALRPRTVVLFGDPAIGTPALRAAPTLALDLPLRALVWQDEAGAVWLTTNAADWMADHVYARHGIAFDPDARRGLADFLDAITRQATQ